VSVERLGDAVSKFFECSANPLFDHRISIFRSVSKKGEMLLGQSPITVNSQVLLKLPCDEVRHRLRRVIGMGGTNGTNDGGPSDVVDFRLRNVECCAMTSSCPCDTRSSGLLSIASKKLVVVIAASALPRTAVPASSSMMSLGPP
jgi:hypothetical protein